MSGRHPYGVSGMNKTQTERFEKFYKVFPHKTAKGSAETAWEKLDPSDELTEKMILAVEAQVRYRAEAKRTGQWMPQWKGPGPWLRAKCYLDEIGSHAELKEKQAAKYCCIEGCNLFTMGHRFPVCEYHFQFTKAGRLRGYLGLVDELRGRYATDTSIQGLVGRDALAFIRRKIGDIGR